MRLVSPLLLSLLLLPVQERSAGADPRLGDPAPLLGLPDEAGKPLRLEQLAGKVVLVDFYATWCEPCHLAMAALGEVKRKLGPRVALVVVDVGEAPAAVQRHLATHPLPDGALLVFDTDRQAAHRWGQTRFPTTFLVDEKGIIRHINRGFGPGYKDRVATWLQRMLAPPP